MQLITGSAGLDDFEWGVTLFGVHPDDLKDVVYTMRFDEASAIYAEFGPFYAGIVTPVEELAAIAADAPQSLGVDSRQTLMSPVETSIPDGSNLKVVNHPPWTSPSSSSSTLPLAPT